MFGKFCWYELMTTDTAAATAFYEKVVGWRAQDSGMPGMAYTILHAGDAPVGGLMAVPEDARKAGARPGWAGYIWVDDVDGTAAKVKAAGGSIHRAADDIPGVGRFAVVADPQGAAFVLFKDAGGERPPLPAPETPGLAGWHELQATDREAAFAFYSEMFGWTKTEAFEMGEPVGLYQLFATGEAALGGMMNKMAGVPMPFWLYYFVVAEIDGAITRVTDGGGQILHGPVQVPGGVWIAQALDPQGAMFAVVGPRV